MLDDLRRRYASIDVTPEYLRLYHSEDPNGRMFAHFQMQLNELFGFMNAKARRNGHYNADQSRELIYLTEEIRDAGKVLRRLGTEITLDESYQRRLDECAGFLLESGGSPIPGDLAPMEIERFRAVFATSNTEVRLPERMATAKLKMVSEGAFAFVYRYVDPLYDVPIALKRAKPRLEENDLVRFRNEFDFMKRINHPYILQVFKYNDETNEYTMEYCDATLRDFIKENNARLRFATRKRIALQFLYGINHLHARDHLHRDVSLQNVLIKKYDGGAVTVKVSDFGLYKQHDSTFTRSESELRGTILDPTIESFKTFNVRNEIYAIGSVISFIFSGREQLGACRGEVRAIVDRCVDLTVENRYPDVRSIIREVERLEAPNEETHA